MPSKPNNTFRPLVKALSTQTKPNGECSHSSLCARITATSLTNVK